LVNRAARFVVSDIDLRSTKRRAYLSPSLNEDQYDYQAPSDLKEQAIVDVARVEGRLRRDKFDMVTREYFDREKDRNSNLINIEDFDFFKKLRISADVRGDDSDVTLHNVDSLTGNGTWAVSGNASNLTLDSDVFIQGSASLNFDMAVSYTAASAVVTGMDQVDVSDYELGGSVFANVYIPDAVGLTSIVMKIGSDTTVFFRQNLTTTNENLAFHIGWNLLRMDLASATEQGTVDMDNVDYIEFGIIGAGSAAASTDWRIDKIVARRGVSHEVYYYTDRAWQNTGGTAYLQDSTATTDKLNADVASYELFVLKLKEILALDLEKFDEADRYEKAYEKMKAIYENNYGSEKLLMIQKNYRWSNDLGSSWLNTRRGRNN